MDNSDLYLKGDIAIQPSRWEGIGLNILESMACGLSVILPNAEPSQNMKNICRMRFL
jgi:glycosyltransferase involved in cell wall biosynthesis